MGLGDIVATLAQPTRGRSRDRQCPLSFRAFQGSWVCLLEMQVRSRPRTGKAVLPLLGPRRKVCVCCQRENFRPLPPLLSTRSCAPFFAQALHGSDACEETHRS
jgi:hypothetical protein